MRRHRALEQENADRKRLLPDMTFNTATLKGLRLKMDGTAAKRNAIACLQTSLMTGERCVCRASRRSQERVAIARRGL